MNAKYPILNYNAQRQKVKHVRKVGPDVRRAVFPHAFSIESIGLCNGARFMVASDKLYAVGVPKFQACEERDGLYTEQTAVDIIA